MTLIKHTIFFFAFLILTSSCKNTNNSEHKSILKYNESAGIVTLDPAFSRDQSHIWICNQLYNSLVKLDDSLNIAPSISKSWNISDDGKTYTFHLRNDVFFHNDSIFKGKPRKVIASDFVYSLNRLLDPATASPGSWVLSDVKSISGTPAIYALNDSTLQILLNRSFPPFLGILAMKYCSVVPHEAIEAYGKEFRNHPVGTGPFRMQNWIENVKLVLRKNPNYFEKHEGEQLPYLDGVSISFLIDKMTAFMEFVKGNFDFISGIDPSYKDELLSRSGNLKHKYLNKFNMIEGPYLNTEYLAFMIDTSLSEADNPLLDINIRKAINYGFDRKKMIHYLRNGIGTPGTKGIIPSGMNAFSNNSKYGYTYNPAKAKKLLLKSGFSNNNPVPPIILVTTPEYLDLCKFVQSQLKNIGITLEIQVSPSATVRELKAHSKIGFFRASWIADYPDEENYLSMFISENYCPNGPNYTHFSSNIIDSLYNTSLSIVDRNIRNKKYIEIDSIITEQAPFAVLYYDQAIRFVQKNISGMTVNPVNLLNLETVRKK